MSALTAKLNLDPSGLKRGASEASRAIGDVSKDLKDLSGDIDRVDGKDARVQVEADVAKAEANLKAVKSDLADLDSTVAEPKIEAPDAGGAGLTAGMDFAGAAKVAIGAAGIATAIVAVFDAGMDRIQVRERVSQQFGLIKEDAERLGAEASDIYAAGWGNSTGEVLASLALIDQKLVQTGTITESETARMAEGALVVADVFGQDVTEVIDAVSKLLLNGLAPDAKTALDIVATGMQEGANGAGDLFDSIDEYSQHFSAFGLSAEDMMALFAAGMANGQRDTDKLADAVKEMRLIMTATGDDVDQTYADLGLSADQFRSAILKGGPAAKEAFGQIIDALADVDDDTERNRLGVEVMGTMYEDLGPTALATFEQMSDGLEDVTGKVDGMNEAMSDTQSEWDLLKRDSKEYFGILAEGFAGGVNWMTETGLAAGLLANDWSDAANTILGKNTELEGSFVAAEPVVENFGKSVDKSKLALEANTDATEDGTGASEDHADALDDEREAVEDLISEIDTLIDSKLDLVGAANDVTRAEIKARDAERDLTAALADGTLTQDEKTIAMLDATDAQVDAAFAAADYEIAQREANGETVSAATKADIQAAALRNVASTLEPGSALQQGLYDLADNIDDIPNEVVTDVTTTGVSETEEQLNRVRNNADSLNGKISTVTVRTVLQTIQANDGRAGGRDSGGYVGEGQVVQVAERRPEFVDGQLITAPTMIAGPANVTSGSETARMLASASTAPTMTGSSATGLASSGGGAITVVNSKASASVADVAMAIRMARY